MTTISNLQPKGGKQGTWMPVNNINSDIKGKVIDKEEDISQNYFWHLNLFFGLSGTCTVKVLTGGQAISM